MSRYQVFHLGNLEEAGRALGFEGPCEKCKYWRENPPKSYLPREGRCTWGPWSMLDTSPNSWCVIPGRGHFMQKEKEEAQSEEG